MRYPWPWPFGRHHAALGALAACFAPGGNPGTMPEQWAPGTAAEIGVWIRYTTRSGLPGWIRNAVEERILQNRTPPNDGAVSLSYAVFAPSNAARLVVIVSDQGEDCASAGSPTSDPYRGPRRSCPVYAVAIDAGGHASPIHQGRGCLPAREAIAPDNRIYAVGHQINEFRYDPATRQLEGRIRDVDTGVVTCTFALPAPNSGD